MLRLFTLLLDPAADDLAGGGATADGANTAPALDSTANVSRSDLDAAPSFRDGTDLGVDPAVDAGQANPGDPYTTPARSQAPAQAQTQTIRDAAAAYGLDLSQYQDDGAAFAHLVNLANQNRQADYYAQLGRQIAPHYQGVTEYLKTQQAAPAATERASWQAPEFDERWMALVDKDPSTGMYVAKPGVNPVFAEKVQSYADHLEGWTAQLARDPEAALSGLIEKIATGLYEQRHQQTQQVAQAQSIVSQNESWLYQFDQAGRRMVGQDGRFVPSPAGARYYTHVMTLKNGGISDSKTLDTLAKQLLQADIYAAQGQGQPNQGHPATPPPAAFNRPNVNASQAVDRTRRPAPPATTTADTRGRSLLEMLRSQISENGITDEDVRQSLLSGA